MTAIHFSAVRGSTGPSLDDSLAQGDGLLDLTGATVVLRLRHGATAAVVDFPMTIDANPLLGRVYRDWTTGDLDILEGEWWGQYRVTIGGAVQIWPTSSTDEPCNSLLGWHGLLFEICAAN